MKRVALIGAESTGKSTLALMLAGRLRTRGVLAALVAEAGSELPFSPELLDSRPEAHAYMIANKMAAEARAALRSNVEFLVSDRSPFDHASYFWTRFPRSSVAMVAMCRAAFEWTRHYDAIYFLATSGSTYVEDGHRQEAATNDYREGVDRFIRIKLPELRERVGIVEEVEGRFRERSEFVYHHILHSFYGLSRPLRAYEQVRDWLRSRGWKVIQVLPQGSESIARFHPASDRDDVDAIVEVDGGADYAVQVRNDFLKHQEQMENIVQANLDLLITPRGMTAYEV